MLARTIISIITLHLLQFQSLWALQASSCVSLDAPTSSIRLHLACLRLRGGSNDEDEEDDSFYSDDEYDYDSEGYDSDDENVRLSEGDRASRSNQQMKPPKQNGSKKSQSSSILSASSMVTAAAKKSIKLTQSAAGATLTQTGRAAYHLATPKHVSKHEICGTWRIDQQVGAVPTSGKESKEILDDEEEDDLPVITCAANVEFTESGEAIVRYSLPKQQHDSDDASDHKGKNQHGEEENGNSEEDDEVITSRSSYTFKERSWPRSCIIEFQLPAFHFPGDDHPVVMRYKGTFKRKLVDPSVIKIVGTIHEVGPPNMRRQGVSRFWGDVKKNRGKKADMETQVGTFTARRRIGLEEKNGESEEYDEWDEDEENYDEYEEED